MSIVPSPATRRSLERATAAYQDQLQDDDKALKYLGVERGYSTEALASFRVGVVRQPLDGHEMFRGRLSVPTITSTGTTGIRFKFLGTPVGKQKKVLAMPGDIGRLYNPLAVLDQTKVYVCEGEPDVWSCWMAGLPAVGIPGADAWRDSYARILRNREVVVLADNDERRPDSAPDDWVAPGVKFANKIYRAVGGCTIIMMPPGHDVSSYRLEYGIEALRERAGLHGETSEAEPQAGS